MNPCVKPSTLILCLAFIVIVAGWCWLMNDCVKARPTRVVVYIVGY